jgi:ATP-binding cassette subfamily B protein
VSGVLLAKVFGNQARDTSRYHQENQRLAGLEVRQQISGESFFAAEVWRADHPALRATINDAREQRPAPERDLGGNR